MNNIINYSFLVLETQPFYKFRIPIKSEGVDEGDGLSCRLTFTYTPKYPDELPLIEIDNEENFNDPSYVNDLLAHLNEQVFKNLILYLPIII